MLMYHSILELMYLTEWQMQIFLSSKYDNRVSSCYDPRDLF